jgi:hypothetical protein
MSQIANNSSPTSPQKKVLFFATIDLSKQGFHIIESSNGKPTSGFIGKTPRDRTDEKNIVVSRFHSTESNDQQIAPGIWSLD